METLFQQLKGYQAFIILLHIFWGAQLKIWTLNFIKCVFHKHTCPQWAVWTHGEGDIYLTAKLVETG